MTAENETGSVRAIAEPQYNLVQVLRPYPGFEADYQGITGLRSIAFTEGGAALDPQAGSPGYSPKLIRGLPVCLGSKLRIWIPAAWSNGNTIQNFGPYNWSVGWRLRNTNDFRLHRLSFHYPKQGLGVPTNAGAARVVLPAAMQSALIMSPGPAIAEAIPSAMGIGAYTDFATHSITAESVQTMQVQQGVQAVPAGGGAPPLMLPPLIPGGATGIIEQGVTPETIGDNGVPMFLIYPVEVEGDEMLLFCTKRNVADNWDFASDTKDKVFSVMFGAPPSATPFPDVGVYVIPGVSP